MSIGYVKERIKNCDFLSFTGFATTGKDEAVKILESIGFKRVSLADPVRQGVYNINPIVFVPRDYLTNKIYEMHSLHNVFDGRYYKLKLVVDLQGWDEAKKIPEVRRLLQYYGTEGGRQIFGDTIWTDTADKFIRENNIKKVAVSDVRFPNELDWVRYKENNLVIKIKRQGVGPINSHTSDLGIADELCDIIIDNDGTLEDLKNKLI